MAAKTKSKSKPRAKRSREPAQRYRTVKGWDHGKTRSEPGQMVPKSTSKKVIDELKRQDAIEPVGKGEA